MTTVPTIARDTGEIIVVALDRAHARFFHVTPAGATELPSLSSPVARGSRFHSDRRDAPGQGEHHYHMRHLEEERRHFAAVSAALARLLDERHVAAFCVAGSGPVTAAFLHRLPAELAGRFSGVTHLDPLEVTPATVASVARDARSRAGRADVYMLLTELAEALGTGTGTNGVAETLRALKRAQVRTLIVRAGHLQPGFRCADSGALVTDAFECRGAAAEPVSDVIAAAMHAAEAQGAEVVMVEDGVVAHDVDGLAALLRFR